MSVARKDARAPRAAQSWSCAVSISFVLILIMGGPMKNIIAVLCSLLSISICCPLVIAQQPNSERSSLVERVGSTGFLQVEAESFNKLTPKQQALAYWLSQASIAVNPIIFD